MKKSHITITDQFCGCGGSSQGAQEAGNEIGGVEITLALNHWKLAIETHNTNFPNTIHDCTDVSACDPRRYPSTNILITSPECTNHSLANGKKQLKKQMDLFEKRIIDPAAERSRATMWDVPRFAEYHKYDLIFVENVIDAYKWVMFESWLHAMHSLGYKHKCVFVNSMFFYPTPQSRDRMYVVFWKKGNKAPDLNYRPLSYCEKCDRNILSVQSWKNSDKKFGKYGIKNGQYVYRCPDCYSIVNPYYYAAFNCIDWNNLGVRIGDRKKPLSVNSIKRIQHGINKYWDNPFLIEFNRTGSARTLSESLSTVLAGGNHHALVNPTIISNYSPGISKGVHESVNTITANDHHSILFPFVIQQEHGHAEDNGKVREINQPMQTQTTRQSFAMVNPPFLIESKKQSLSREINDPISCITTKPYHGLITDEAFKSFISCYNGNGADAYITEAANCITTNDRLSLVNYQKPNIEDCYFRMLQAPEVQRAMAFNDNYIVLGSSKDKVKQLGNAVTPPAMKWLVSQGIKSLM